MNDHTLRIIQIMQDKKMNATQFSEAIGIQRTNMSHITLGRNNPSADVLTKIIERFSDINPGWLLSGKGDMRNMSEYQENSLMNEIEFNQSYFPDEKKTKNLTSPTSENDLFITSELADRTYESHKTPAYHVLKAPVIMPEGAIIRPEIQKQVENQQGNSVDQADNNSKIIEKEIVIYKEKSVKAIEKIVIFFSDKSFETFIPELADSSA